MQHVQVPIGTAAPRRGRRDSDPDSQPAGRAAPFWFEIVDLALRVATIKSGSADPAERVAVSGKRGAHLCPRLNSERATHDLHVSKGS